MDVRIDVPAQPRCAFVLAHGAGAGMDHPFLATLARGLSARGIATLRYEFPYMANRSRRPDPPAVAHAAVRAAIEEAAARWPGLPLFAGGKSFGGRMTSQAQAIAPLRSVRGLVFVGFPLHPAGKPAIERGAHLSKVALPMIFLQGTRDALADRTLLASVIGSLQPRATLHEVDEADHAFHVPKRSGRTDADVLEALADTAAAWMKAHADS